MEVLPPEAFPGRDEASLLRFLAHCRERAAACGRTQYAAITLPVRHLSPLAVIESIHETGVPQAYLEHPASAQALAGVEPVASHEASGPTRFAQIRDWARAIFDDTLTIAEAGQPLVGPCAFCTFSFEDTQPEQAPVAAASVFVPRWQVVRFGGTYSATATLRIAPQGDSLPQALRVLAAFQKFSAYDYAAPEVERPEHRLHVEEEDSAYTGKVRQALAEIAQGRYEKVVLARALTAKSQGAFRLFDSLYALRETFPDCHLFAFSGKGDRTFIGASPERLVCLRDGEIRTEALAGSAPRGVHARSDASLAGALLGSEKDGREHRLVLEDILARLRALGLEPQADPLPTLAPLANVQHLRTGIRATNSRACHLLDLAATLHPTPAVAGFPREAALEALARMEGGPRGPYAGLVGWFDAQGEGELAVGIRSALVSGETARLYAGAGIVSGSEPEREFDETVLKLQALLSALR